MKNNLAEIATLRARLRGEIMERECLLAALDVVKKYAARGHAPQSMELGNLVAALLPTQPTVELRELSASLPPPAPAALPPPPPVELYIHPELKDWKFGGHGAQANLVRWAIARMTEDYSLHGIAAVLKREGRPMGSPEISVVLTRLKARGEIQEIKRSAGPHPALFRKPEGATSLATASEDPVANAETTATSIAVS